MKNNLISLLNQATRKQKLTILITFAVFFTFYFQVSLKNFNEHKGKITIYAKNSLKLNTNSILQESEFIKNLLYSTPWVDVSIQPNDLATSENTICTIFNCYVLNFEKLMFHYFFPPFVFLFSILTLVFLMFKIQRQNVEFFKSELKVLTELLKGEHNFAISDFSTIESQIAYKTIIQNQNLKQEIIKSELKSSVFKQVAHDIRSPLEALQSLNRNLDNLDFSSKDILNKSINRIINIANNLLYSETNSSNSRNPESNICNIYVLLNDLYQEKCNVTDKKLKLDIQIDFNDSFVSANDTDLYRTFSNILNNSLESIPNQNGSVKISADLDCEEIIIKIQDNGCGIPSEVISKIQAGGYTTKSKGHGLGVSSSKLTVEKYGGSFFIQSKIDQGTSVTIRLRKTNSPQCIKDTISIPLNISTIVCFDDDTSFLEIYKQKFNSSNYKFLLFSEIDDFDNFFTTSDINDTFYLIDYDLNYPDFNGIDFIKKYNISNRSYLVTSKFLDWDLITKSNLSNYSIFPKQIINNFTFDTCINLIVLIDDDALIRLFWETEASIKKIKLITFVSIEDFISRQNEFHKMTKIYIDSQLGNDLQGEIESEKIYKLGFRNLHLATGKSITEVIKPTWIKSITGKSPPF